MPAVSSEEQGEQQIFQMFLSPFQHTVHIPSQSTELPHGKSVPPSAELTEGLSGLFASFLIKKPSW